MQVWPPTQTVAASTWTNIWTVVSEISMRPTRLGDGAGAFAERNVHTAVLCDL